MIAVGSEGQRSALSVLLDHLHSFLFGGGGGGRRHSLLLTLGLTNSAKPAEQQDPSLPPRH